MSRQNSEITSRARALRRKDNDAEAKLWAVLRNRNLNAFKFVREHPVPPYFADFACRRKRLIVEVDGSQHRQGSYDDTRDSFLNQKGWAVVRFWNTDVLREPDIVTSMIVDILEGRIWKKEENSEWRFWPAVKQVT